MIALIKKSFDNNEWIVGFCGSPSNIAIQFLDSGIKEAYAMAWSQCPESVGASAVILNNLLETSKQACTVRKDIEDINFNLAGWSYLCIGCAETQEEAAILCDKLEFINSNAECTSNYRKKHYFNFIDSVKTRFSSMSENELRKLLSAAMNLKL